MKEIQFIYPWTHPFFAGFVIMLLGLSFLVGCYLIYRTFRVKKVSIKSIMFIISILLIGIPLFNIIGFQFEKNKIFERYSGVYSSSKNQYKLNLLKDNTWTSDGIPLKYESGFWELEITEDGRWIELKHENSKYGFVQLWPSNEGGIRIGEILLRKE